MPPGLKGTGGVQALFLHIQIRYAQPLFQVGQPHQGRSALAQGNDSFRVLHRQQLGEPPHVRGPLGQPVAVDLGLDSLQVIAGIEDLPAAWADVDQLRGGVALAADGAFEVGEIGGHMRLQAV